MKLSKMYEDGQEEYVDDESAAALESLPESAWPIIVKTGEAMVGGGDSPGIDYNVTATPETIEDFLLASASWRDYTSKKIVSETPAIIAFEGVQALKGQRRCAITIIDLGALRVVLTA